MKSDKGIHNSRRKNATLKELEQPKARLVEYRYTAIRRILTQLYPGTLETFPKDKLEDIIFDAISIDRLIRQETQDEQKEEKKILSEHWKLDNL